jgi:HNH endonuclease
VGERTNAVQACIYCGSTEDLTDEHIIPYGLGGDLVLPKASCRACATITSDFERRVQRGFMLEGRTAADFPTRRPKERLASRLLRVERKGRRATVELPLPESGGTLQLPMLERAAFLSARPLVAGVNVNGMEVIGFGKSLVEIASEHGADAISTTAVSDVSAFVRLLAKIGYSHAVKVMGPCPRGEVPVLPLILGLADDGSTWVGSAKYRLAVEDRHPTHALAIMEPTALVVDGVTESIVVVRGKLFANSGATGYEVVVRRFC